MSLKDSNCCSLSSLPNFRISIITLFASVRTYLKLKGKRGKENLLSAFIWLIVAHDTLLDTKSSRSQGPIRKSNFLLPKTKVLKHLFILFGRAASATGFGFYLLTAFIRWSQTFAFSGFFFVNLFELGVTYHWLHFVMLSCWYLC